MSPNLPERDLPVWLQRWGTAWEEECHTMEPTAAEHSEVKEAEERRAVDQLNEARDEMRSAPFTSLPFSSPLLCVRVFSALHGVRRLLSFGAVALKKA
jgi:hypothetical protein